MPKVNGESARRLYRALSSAIRSGLVASCHDCSDGGLAVALAETAFAGGFGMTVDLGWIPAEGVDRDDHLLFSESQSRFVVTIAPRYRKDFEKVLEGNAFAAVGAVMADGVFRLRGLGRNVIVEERIEELNDAWRKPLAF